MPEVGWVAGQSPSHGSARAMRAGMACKGRGDIEVDSGGGETIGVAVWAIRRTMVSREATKREPTLWGRGRVESRAQRRPKSGWVGSVTSPAVGSSTGGWLRGV